VKVKALLEVRNDDLDLRRKGRVLAVMLLGMMASVLIVEIFNAVQGGPQYFFINGAFFLVLLSVFVLNRSGFVLFAGLFTVVLTGIGSFLLIDENLRATFIAMPIPVLIASFMFVPWAGFVVATIMIGSAIILGIESLALLILTIVAVISYLFANSLDHAYRESRYQALHDSLTDLPNRTLFFDRLEQAVNRARRTGKLTAVVFMDLDNFKVINDSLGHDLGDKLLIQVSQRIYNCLRDGDTLARLGGDEFTILLEDITEVGDAIYVAERLLSELREPFKIGRRQISITSSTGIALSSEATEQPSDLLRNADVAMYQAKRSRGRYEVFQASMFSRALNRMRIEEDLRRDIERGVFEVYYQPKVLLSTGKIVEMEALVRWGSSNRGLVMPSEFIQVAEETGLIIPIGQQVLEQACRQAREWHARCVPSSRIRICVNLSVRQLQNPHLVDDIDRVLRRTGLGADNLQLEITESTLMETEKHAIDLLRDLRALGVQISIDDFGKGFSSLNYVKDLPITGLKIDKSFIDGLEKDTADAAIVSLIIDLAHTLGLEVTAEGVENEQQLARLIEMGCDLGQGFYFSKPLPSTAAGTLIVTGSSA